MQNNSCSTFLLSSISVSLTASRIRSSFRSDGSESIPCYNGYQSQASYGFLDGNRSIPKVKILDVCKSFVELLLAKFKATRWNYVYVKTKYTSSSEFLFCFETFCFDQIVLPYPYFLSGYGLPLSTREVIDRESSLD